jgi:hypothetical protein
VGVEEALGVAEREGAALALPPSPPLPTPPPGVADTQCVGEGEEDTDTEALAEECPACGLPVPRGGKIQEQKSAITYMRRAGYEALLGLAPADSKSDDDGDAANRVTPPDDPAEARRMEMTARLKIGAAKTKDELLGLVNRVQLKFDSGELPKAAVERLLKLADERRRAIPGD